MTPVHKRRYAADGTHLTDCCGAYSTYCDDTLVCRACQREVERGEGDGTETLVDGLVSLLIADGMDVRKFDQTSITIGWGGEATSVISADPRTVSSVLALRRL